MAARKIAPEPTPRTPKETFQKLTQVAASLNAASDQLAHPIRACEAVLKSLNLGVSAWVTISRAEHDSGAWWDRSVGYAQYEQSWRILLRHRNGSGDPEDGIGEDIWPFDSAPRWQRVAAVAKLPELLAALLKRSEETVAEITSAVEKASDLAIELATIAGPAAGWKSLLQSAILPFGSDVTIEATSASEVTFANGELSVVIPAEYKSRFDEHEIGLAIQNMHGVHCLSIAYANARGDVK